MSALAQLPNAAKHLRRELGEILAIPDLGRYWIGQLVSQVGSGATLFVLMTSVYLETGSLVWFALLFAIDNVPPLVLAPVAGTLVDRCDRRLLHIIGDGGVAIVTVAAIGLWAQDWLSAPTIFALVLASSTFQVLQGAAAEAMYQQLIPKHKLVRVGAILGSFDELIEVFAPALGVTLMALSSAGVVFTLDLLTFVFALWTLFSLANPDQFRSHLDERERNHTNEHDEQQGTGSIAFFLEGFHYLRRQPGLKFLFFYGVVDDFFSALVLLMAAAAALQLGGEPVLAIVQSAAGVGAILGMLLIAIFGLMQGQIIRRNVILPGLIIALCMMTIPLASSAIALAIGAFAFMLLSAPLDAALYATYMSAVPKSLIGRIGAVFDIASGIANLVVLLVIAQLIERVLTPALAANPVAIGSISIGGTDAKLDALLVTIGISGIGLLVLNLCALKSKSRVAADDLALDIQTTPTLRSCDRQFA